ncbi:MAG: 23S rRNA (adenine(2503)-C(2))-methyltransferase RlmN [Phycisphaerales bacterium]|nr:23S rRNA (adenine(2503)-C(2))-methyltransferase RlmN [Phycisphaerales bacterium]
MFHHTPETLRAWFKQRELPTYRADQVLDWVYRKGVVDPALMSNLGKRDREVLASEMTFVSGEIVRQQVATDGTQKLLLEWSDASRVGEQGAAGVSLPMLGAGTHTDRQTECVMIPSEDPTKVRRTACISSQVGCPVGCRFCASGLGGLDGNLTAGRIVEQVWRLNQMLAAGAEESSPNGEDAAHSVSSSPRLSVSDSAPRVTNIVFMGMGEPLANFSNVLHAVRTIAAPWGVGISARKITISTVGLPKAITRLTEELELPVTLALSLHAPNDELRRELIPWAEYTTIPELLAACQGWFKKLGREITLEYILLGDVNDRPEHAAQLAGIAKSLRANINLIRYNEVEPLPFRRPRADDVHEFQRILRARGVNAHIRASRGRDIAAACGQLRHEARV